MRWWLNTDHKMFSVDNASVAEVMDFSSLDDDIWMIRWIDGRGEIERQTAEGENLNGMRERFYDVIPYAPFFQQFLTHLPGLTLDQSKQTQIELIAEIYNTKRQLPFPYSIDGTPYTWDATDGTTAAMSLQVMPAIFNGLGAGSGVTDNLVSQINTKIVIPGNTAFNVFNANASSSVGLRDHLNNTVLGTWVAPPYPVAPKTNTLNNQLRSSVPYPSEATGWGTPSPGLDTDIAHSTVTFSTAAGLSTITAPTAWSQTIPWTPLELTSPLNLTISQMVGIMSGISARQQTLNGVRSLKTNAVNVLTTIAAVIDYDVTTGW